jgi:hypothetical protein
MKISFAFRSIELEDNANIKNNGLAVQLKLTEGLIMMKHRNN